MASDTHSGVTVLPDSREMPRFRWTREQFHKLIRDGFVCVNERCELIAGEIVLQGQWERGQVECRHATFNLLQKACGKERTEFCWSAALSDFDEPRPAVIVLGRPSGEFVRFPGPEDLLLVVEVAGDLLDFACGAKSLLYARAKVPEYWVFDVNTRRLIVRRDPLLTGYRTSLTLTDGDKVWPLCAPGNALHVTDLLPPSTTL